MKKLMFTDLVACAAAFSASAAEFIWGFSSDSCMKPDGSDYLDSGTAMLYLGTVTYADGTGFDTIGATLLTTAGQDATYYTFGHFSESGMPSDGSVAGTGGQAYTLILVDQSSIASIDGYTGSYYMSTGTSGTGYYLSGTDRIDYAIMQDATAIPGTGWSTAAAPTPPTPPTPGVPEPTSGLLLVVGGAMLALRRHRA